MKQSFLFLLLLCSNYVFAQPSKEDIVKFKIKKVTITTAGAPGDESNMEYYYDEKGNDTAMYSNGSLNWSIKFEKNANGTIVKSVRTGRDENPETGIYKYRHDGSYYIESTDKQFGLTTKYFYDKKGKLVKTVIPDGSERIYTYDAKGKLIKLHSVPKNDGVKITQIYTYNGKGQLISIKSVGDYPWTQKLFYDAKGLLSKAETTSTFSGEKEVTVYTYSYEFR